LVTGTSFSQPDDVVLGLLLLLHPKQRTAPAANVDQIKAYRIDDFPQ
jgi:hypothetical protein